jgi:hypothetical protein
MTATMRYSSRPGHLIDGTSRNALSMTSDLLDPQQPIPLGRHLSQLILACTPEGYCGTLGGRAPASGPSSDWRPHVVFNGRVLRVVLLQNVRLSDVAPSVNSSKRDEDPTISIDAACTGALAAHAHIFAHSSIDGTQAASTHTRPSTRDRPCPETARELVNAPPWPKDRLYSVTGLPPGLLVLLHHGFVSALQASSSPSSKLR